MAPDLEIVETDKGLMLRIGALLQSEGVIESMGALEFEPLDGGVSSTLLRVRDTLTGRSWCAKRPLTRLKVAGDWQASPERSASEVAWLETVAAWHPDAVPRIVARDADAHLFVMDDYPPPEWRPWKPLLLAGEIDVAVGERLGTLIGDIHISSMGKRGMAGRFATDALFHALRIRPFLHAGIEAHPDLRVELRAIEADLRAAPRALVHGDVSPKNLLIHDDGRILLLDAECAWWGGPHFDAAFLLCHLLLKWAHAPHAADAWLELARSFHGAWNQAREARPGDPSDTRCALLLPALLLARIDGLSPVDYLSAEWAARVRSFARTQIRVRPDSVELLLQRYARAMGDID